MGTVPLKQLPHPPDVARLPGVLRQVHVRRVQRAPQLGLRRLKLLVGRQKFVIESADLVALLLGLVALRGGLLGLFFRPSGVGVGLGFRQ
jgi:hypothetical protein